MKSIVLGATIFVLISTTFLCADFEESAKLLMPLNQLEAKINNVATAAGIDDWDERFYRFKKHLEILKYKEQFKELMDVVEKRGFSEGFPLRAWEVLSILGFKPFTEPESWGKKRKELFEYVNGLVNQGELLDIKVEDKYVTSKPTIPFEVVFKSYELDDVARNEKLWKREGFDALSLFKDFDSEKEQAGILFKNKMNIGVLTSETTYGTQSIDALFLGLQPLATLVQIRSAKLNFLVKHFSCLLGLVEICSDPLCSKTIKDFRQWGWFDDAGNEYVDGPFVRALSFCSNPKNYRVLLYPGKIFYNDNSVYINLTGLLTEFFFQVAFSDQLFLKQLYDRLTKMIKKAALFSIEDKGVDVKKFILKDGVRLNNNHIFKKDYELPLKPYFFDTWEAFDTAHTGPAKETLIVEQKNSYPPIIPVFKEFLKRLFGPEGETWNWNDANTLTFVDEKKDIMLVNFLEHVEGGLTLQLQALNNQVHTLKIKLEALKVGLENLKTHLDLQASR